MKVAAMRERDYIESYDNIQTLDSFILSSSREVERKIMEPELHDKPLFLRERKGVYEHGNVPNPIYRDYYTQGRLSRDGIIQYELQRLDMAVMCGVFLVGPMWLKVLQTNL